MQYAVLFGKSSEELRLVLGYIENELTSDESFNLIFNSQGIFSSLQTQNSCPVASLVSDENKLRLSAFEQAIVHKKHDLLLIFGKLF